MKKGLPLEILGWVGPILKWVEDSERLGLPRHWGSLSAFAQERDWMQRELPTASHDTLTGILSVSRGQQKPSQSLNWEKPPMDPPQDYPIALIFAKLADNYLTWVGNELCIRKGKLVELHELARRFPVPHLIRFSYAFSITRRDLSLKDCLKRPMRLELLPVDYHGLRRKLEKGLYEGHLHLVSLLGPEEIWIDDMLGKGFFSHRRHMETDENRLSFLGRALLSLLSMVLILHDQGLDPKDPVLGHLASLQRFFDELYLSEPKTFQSLASNFVELHNKACDALMDKNLVLSEENRWLLPLIHPARFAAAEYLNGVRLARSVQERLSLMTRFHIHLLTVLIWNENVHQSSILGAINPKKGLSEGEPSVMTLLLERWFFRYMIVHTHHWQQSTQKTKVTGLAHFSKSRKTGHRRQAQKKNENLWLSLDYSCRSKSLIGLEGRIAPPSSSDPFKIWLLGLYKHGLKQGSLQRFGLVVHFKKTLGEKPGNANSAGSRHGGHDYGLRYGPVRRTTAKEARSLYRLLMSPDPMASFIVGIDAASQELATPPEVFAPAFRFLRDRPIEPGQNLDHLTFATNTKIRRKQRERRLGMTYHVGEDFLHLLSGVRAIDEAIEFLNPHPGDRLGHAIALGLDPEQWLIQNSFQAVITKQELLDTLVWLHQLLGPGHYLIGELNMENRIQCLSREIYDVAEATADGKGRRDDWPIPTLYDAWKLRQLDPDCLELGKLFENKLEFTPPPGWGKVHMRWLEIQQLIGGRIEREVGSKAAFGLLGKYWSNEKQFCKGEEWDTLDMHPKKESWLAAIQAAQDKLRNKILKRHLIVETCPTSNLMIGPINAMEDHQIFDLSLDKNYDLKREVRLTVNTDNPGLLVTSLEHEYYQLAEVLLEKGVPEAKVLNWLDWLRQNGEDSAFLTAAPDPHLLKRVFKKNKKILHRAQGRDGIYFWRKWAEQQERDRKKTRRRYENPSAYEKETDDLREAVTMLQKDFERNL